MTTTSTPIYDITTLNITGTTGSDTLYGGYGADIINGGKGNDVLYGGRNIAADSLYMGGSWMPGSLVASDTYVFKKGDGQDIIKDTRSDSMTIGDINSEIIKFLDVKSTEVKLSSADGIMLTIHYGLTDQVQIYYPTKQIYGFENSALKSIVFSDGIEWTGLVLQNKIASALTKIQNGTAANDSLLGVSGLTNVLNGFAGNDTLIGADLDDRLNGGDGNDYLDGRTGTNNLTGGLGNDTYVHRSWNDNITELAGQGTDRVFSSDYSYTLGANIENLILTGTVATYGAGNELNNMITGSVGANYLSGYAGNDNLNGRGGADTLVGGLGNDTYVINSVDSAASIIELAGQGVDKVLSSVSYTLGVNLENLTLSESGSVYSHQAYGYNSTLNRGEWSTFETAVWGNAINGTGNSLNNAIVGNSSDNVLTGAKGNDSLTGGFGQDTFVFRRGDGKDVVTDFQSYDNISTADHLRWVDSSGNVVIEPKAASSRDTIKFSSGVNHNQLWFSHVGNDLLIETIGTSDSVLVKNWDTSFMFANASIITSDGYTILAEDVENLVSAMAAFMPPAAGQTTLPSNYQTELAPVIAANWH